MPNDSPDVNRAFAVEATLVDRPAPVKKKKVFNPYKSEKRVCITLERSEKIPPTGQFFGYTCMVAGEDGKPHPVPREFILRPGEKTWVPEGLLGVLNDAVEDVPVLGGDGTLVVGYESRLRFAYRVHDKEMIPAEYAEDGMAEAA